MKMLIVATLALTALTALTPSVDAKTYSVKNIGKEGLKTACANGGGSFIDGANSYSCTYKNGNIRECSKSDKHCITETPKLTGPETAFGQMHTGLDHLSVVDGGDEGGPSKGKGTKHGTFSGLVHSPTMLAQ